MDQALSKGANLSLEYLIIDFLVCPLLIRW
jgi:hypothetical protein